MKRAQLMGVGIAGVCALGAFFVMKGIVNKPRQEAKVEVHTNTVDVLVAKSDIGLGHVAEESSFRWQAWPEDAVPPGAISSRNMGNAMQDMKGRIARAPIMAGEPITHARLVKPGEGGVLASILPQGMRAISTKITEDTGVGRLILPNDHVDVILIKRERGRGGKEDFAREMLFRNVRVLAIGQRIEVKDGQKVADGNTATLELTAGQAEKLALAKMQGELTLSLRSVADIGTEDVEQTDGKRGREGEGVRTTRYGIRRTTN